MRHYFYTIDDEGKLWHENSEIKDEKTLLFFMHRLEKDEQGKYFVLCQGEFNSIAVENVPYIVQNLTIGKDKIQLGFPGKYRQELDLNSLFIAPDQRLYCRVRKGNFLARFNRNTFYEIANFIHTEESENHENFYVLFNNTKYPISCTKNQT